MRSRNLLRDESGAVLPEFIVVFAPLLATFFAFMQVAQIYLVQQRMRDGLQVVARLTATTADAPGLRSNPERSLLDHQRVSSPTFQEQAFLATLGKYRERTAIGSLLVSTVGPMTSVSMSADFSCSIPLGRNLVCQGGKSRFEQTLSFPYQGVHYERD